MPEIATGVHRLGDDAVNFFLLEGLIDGKDGLTLVDAGLPAHYKQLTALLGPRIADIRAVLLTHAHIDHIGLAGRLHREVGAAVHVHAGDAAMLARPVAANGRWKAERSLLPYALRRPAALRAPLHLATHGAFWRTPPVPAPVPITANGTLSVPGRPTAVAVPGHTAGSVAFHFPEHGVLCTGDALVTDDSIIGRRGPRIVCRAFTADSAAALRSLDALAGLDATLVLPGHGAPFDGAPADAVAAARAAGAA
ncbi:MBL fold metallo-hydrolase [Dactylosporangium sp. NPDC049525]|uniref:MBL fold metallo-hydrolase n=1 Tax=Dactylosporangium sp. NPDC049525 TaxID=3154730 RepID=UPI00342298C7